MVNPPSKPVGPAASSPDKPAEGATAATAVTEEKKKKKKYSRGLKFPQKAEVQLTRGAHRLARAVEEGLGLWRERRDGSARKKRNGALRDAVKNYGKAVTKFHKVAAKLPEDVTKNFPKIRIFG